MEELMLNSKAGGTWEYEIEEKVEGVGATVKVKHAIKKGFNTVPGSHVETLEKDPGYVARVKKGTYVILKGGKALSAKKKAESADGKALDDAKDVENAKDLYKKKISDLKDNHAEELKKEKEIYKAEYQKLIESRGEALRKVKELEDEKLSLVGQISQLEAGSGKEVEFLKKEVSELKSDLEKQSKNSESELNTLKTESQKTIKALEGKNEALEKKVQEQAGQIKNMKKK